eukprot:jgi/Antlo1/965/1465
MLLYIALCLCAVDWGSSNMAPYTLIGNKPVQIRSVADPLFSLQLQGDVVHGSYMPSVSTLLVADENDWTMSDWVIFMKGFMLCHKKRNIVGVCGKDDLATTWKIRMRYGGAFVFKTRTPTGWYCMTLDPPTRVVSMNPCLVSDPHQMFFLRNSLFSDFLLPPLVHYLAQ